MTATDDDIPVLRIGTRTFYGTPHGVYLDCHPYIREAGTEFELLAAPNEYAFDDKFKAWRIERWRCVEGGVMPLSSTPMTDKQVAWVKRAFPGLWT